MEGNVCGMICAIPERERQRTEEVHRSYMWG